MAITTKDAIRIAHIIATCPEQRLTMIMSALELADISLEGLEEIEAYRRIKNGVELADVTDLLLKLDEIMSHSLTASLQEEENQRWYKYELSAKEFSEACISAGVNPKGARKLLAEKGFLKLDSSGRSSVVVKRDGKNQRITVLQIPEHILMER